jgi:large subunit ribosomal protein L25
MGANSSTLKVTPREAAGSRSARRLRRTGQVPAVIYGGTGEPVAVQLEALNFKRIRAHSGSVLDLELDGDTSTVLLKDLQRHPVTSEPVHADFLRVRMDVAIQTTVVVELSGHENSPGSKEGGVLEQVLRDVNIEALPGNIPEHLEYDVSAVEMNETVTLAALTLPEGVTLVDDPEGVLVTCTPPRLEVETDDELETETERIGDEEGAEGEAGDGDGDGAPDADAGAVEG